MQPLPDRGRWPRVPLQRKPAQHTTRSLARFLDHTDTSVLDIVPGASPGSRRLLLGQARSGAAGYAVAVVHQADGPTSIDTEEEVLGALPGRLRPELMMTAPQPVERVEVTTTLQGLVVTAVPGLRPTAIGRARSAARPSLDVVYSWLVRVWEDTAGSSAQVDLGNEATAAMIARYGGSARLAPVIGSIQRARSAIADFGAPLTLSHGCLCPRHTRADADTVIGVDDWGRASTAANPLRDLGRFAVREAGVRLPGVVAGRTSYAGSVRSFVSAGLERHDLPRHLWREVLVLTQLELAVEALGHGDTAGISLLITAVRELPGQRRRDEART